MKKTILLSILAGLASSPSFAGQCIFTSAASGGWTYDCTEGALKYGINANLAYGSAVLAFFKAAEASGMSLADFRHEFTQSRFVFRTKPKAADAAE